MYLAGAGDNCESASSFLNWLLEIKNEITVSKQLWPLWLLHSNLESTLLCKIPEYQLQYGLPAIEFCMC